MMAATKRPIRILHLEDNPRDAELIQRRLASAGLDCEVVRVGGQEAFEAALAEGKYDLVLCDFNVPGYDALSALKHARANEPDLPFVVISGELSEEEAVECLRAGATDYLLKHRLQRLASAVIRALDEAVERENRRQAEIARSESEDRFRSVVAAMAEGVIVQDWRGNIVASNAAALRMLGVTEEELRGRSANRQDAVREDGSLFPNDEYPALATLRTGLPQSQVVMGVRRGDGALRWISINTEPLKHPGAEAAYAVVTTLSDITDRKRAEQALRESEERFRLMVEHVVDYAIVALDVEGRVLTWNAGAERAHGYQAEEIIGQHISRFYPPEDVAARVPGRLLEQARSEGHAQDEGWRVRKDGSRFLANLVVTAVRDERGELRGFSKVTRDMTERRQMEQRLRQSEKMEAIGQLTGGVAHDFNNLLGIVIGNLDLLERALPGNESALKRVQTAQRAALRGADLTKRLLAFSRRQQLEVEPLSVRETIDNLVGMAVRTLGPEIRITTRVDENLAPVLADAAGLESALLNLAINSRDAMPSGGELTFAARSVALDASYPAVQAGEIKTGTYACISVSDTGQGIPPEVLEKAFEPFFTTKEKGKGTGLGLAMVYGLVKQLKGHVNIYSEVGQGTTVRLYLPFANGVAPAPAVGSARQLARFGGTALVVDDEVDLLEVAVAFLEDMGWTVLCAPDALAAMEVVERRPAIDLLLTDVVMPGGMNGLELAQKATAARPGLKVIYSTGFSSVALAQRNGLVVSGKVLSKPYRRDEFVAAVHEVMEQKRG
jgi:PAS domain S-box-containing protein